MLHHLNRHQILSVTRSYKVYLLAFELPSEFLHIISMDVLQDIFELYCSKSKLFFIEVNENKRIFPVNNICVMFDICQGTLSSTELGNRVLECRKIKQIAALNKNYTI